VEDCEGAAHFQVGEVAIKTAEDAGVVAVDVEDLVALQVKMTVQGFDTSISTGATRTLRVSGSKETAGCSSISITGYVWL
jgi:hypothetical protein